MWKRKVGKGEEMERRIGEWEAKFIFMGYLQSLFPRVVFPEKVVLSLETACLGLSEYR